MSEAEVIKQLQEDVAHLQSEVFRLQKNQSSRVGLQGGRGEKGDIGASGRDAILRVVTDVKENIVHVFDETGAERASLISIPGKDGKDSPSLEEIVKAVPKPKDGKDGRNAPSLQEIVTSVLAEIHRRTSN
jgi:hypothetical protein